MYRIMLVDDESSVLKGLSELLDWSASDAEVVASASGGQEALSLLRKVPVQILITDICMPEMDGLTLIREARALNPALRCIVVSAHDEFEYVRRALTLGVENYLLKPINAGELAETLATTIENIERAGPSEAMSPEEAAFRNNILDRWANSSIQDFELAERAALLQISLDAREYLALVSVPVTCSGVDGRLSVSAPAMEAMKRSLIEAGFGADVFIDRHANLAAILHGEGLQSHREALQAALKKVRECSGRPFTAAGPAVPSAYLLDASYRCAYSLLPLRHLEPDAPFAWCGDYPMAGAFASAEMLAFEQALEIPEASAAMDAAARGVTGRAPRTFAQSLKQMMPYELKLLACFDDSMHKATPVPECVLRQLRALPMCADSAAAFALFGAAVGDAARELKSRQGEVHPVVRRVLDIVNASFDKDLSLKVVADQVNMHPSYFGQLFREETGQLFNDYLTSLRLKKARSMLAGTGKKIGEVSAAVGIAQQSYFNRLFKKEYGITPMEYRRELTKHRE